VSTIVSGILGTSLLLIGRKLFWLFIGAVGFAIGLMIANRIWEGNGLVGLFFGLGLGLAFALLAVFVQSIAIGATGFFAGGYVALALAGLLHIDRARIEWIIFVVGGILGAILVGALLDWALISLASLTGANMIAHAFAPDSGREPLLVLVLFVIGVVVQAAQLRREHAPRHA
jgi:hypothetical protein